MSSEVISLVIKVAFPISLIHNDIYDLARNKIATPVITFGAKYLLS